MNQEHFICAKQCFLLFPILLKNKEDFKQFEELIKEITLFFTVNFPEKFSWQSRTLSCALAGSLFAHFVAGGAFGAMSFMFFFGVISQIKSVISVIDKALSHGSVLYVLLAAFLLAALFLAIRPLLTHPRQRSKQYHLSVFRDQLEVAGESWQAACNSAKC